MLIKIEKRNKKEEQLRRFLRSLMKATRSTQKTKKEIKKGSSCAGLLLGFAELPEVDEIMIKVNNLTKTYANGDSRLYALNNISFDIAEREFVVILGASGSGKSTLLNAVAGLEKPDEGSIIYGDREICGLTDRELTKFRRDKTAFVFQSYYLLPSLSVEANIKMGANLGGVKEFGDIIRAVGLSGKEKNLPSQLSGGEQQRVSIARAIAKNPQVLFCDEPTGALDEATGRQILKYLAELQREKGLCVVMVTHNANIADIATKVIKMNSGKIVEIIDNKNPADVDSIGW